MLRIFKFNKIKLTWHNISSSLTEVSILLSFLIFLSVAIAANATSLAHFCLVSSCRIRLVPNMLRSK